MTDGEKYEALTHLIALLNQTKLPCLRDTGISLETWRALRAEGLVEGAIDGSVPETNLLERIGVYAVNDSAKSWILRYEAQSRAHEATLAGTFSSTWRNKFVEFVWGLIGLIAGAIIGWYLHEWFG